MEEEKKLYPLSFCVNADEYSWGVEEFRLADLGYKDSLIKEGWLAGNSLSEVMDTYVERLVGDNILEFYGRQFPICLRYYKIKDKMPLRVSPEDELAADRFNFLGKERLWYVAKTGKGAKISLGFSVDTDASQLYAKCIDGSIEQLLNNISPKEGDFYFIPSGTPFSAQGDIEILEISESSPLDFTLCAWGKEIEGDDFDKSLNIEEALDFIDYKAFKQVKLKEDTIISLPQFIVKRIKLATGLHSETKEGSESFTLYSCLKGEASVQIEVYGQLAAYKIKPTESILLPAECTSFNLIPLAPGTELIETSIIAMNVDKYIKE